MSDDRLADLIARRLDGGLDAEGLAELAAQLRADPAARKAFRRELRLHALLREEARLRGAEGRPTGRIDRTIRPRRWRWTLPAAAALVAAGLAIAFFLSQRDPVPGGPLEAVASLRGGGTLARGPVEQHVSGKVLVHPGDRLDAVAGAELRWPDGSTLDLHPGCSLQMDPGASKAVTIITGAIGADIAAQDPATPFSVGLGGHRLLVIGTHFDASWAEGSARCSVSHGCIAVRAIDQGADKPEALVFAGESWVDGKRIPDPSALAKARNLGPVTDRIIALWRFDEGQGMVVHDRSGVGDPINLALADPANGRWEKGGLTLLTMDALRFCGPAAKLREAMVRGTGFAMHIGWSAPEGSGDTATELLGMGTSDTNPGPARGMTLLSSGKPGPHTMLMTVQDGQMQVVDDLHSRLVQPSERWLKDADRISKSPFDLEIVLPSCYQTWTDGQRTRSPWTPTIHFVAIYAGPTMLEDLRRNSFAWMPE